MNVVTKSLSAIACIAAFSYSKPANSPEISKPQKSAATKIQVAVLLDVSNSMDGLIDQAKAQLWNMVTTLGKARCDDNTIPSIELALYEYGREDNDAKKGYVKQLSPFSNDLDGISQTLFGLTTHGGDEYCGQVIYTSMDELKWDPSANNYKVIFIAGNEDFLQGKLHYTQACKKAKEKGVIVNTVYCGDYQQGIAEHWNLGGECGNGSFTNIDQNAKEIEIPTPYDTTLITLNNLLNNTYIGYGSMGVSNMARQKKMDASNFSMNNNVAAKRISAKAQSNVYNNASWDLVDAYNADSTYIKKVDKVTLPENLKDKSAAELETFVQEKSAERTAIQKQITAVNISRNQYIADEKAKAALQNNEPTLETAVEKIIKKQVLQFNMKID